MAEIIPQNELNMHCSWQKELANVVTDPKELLRLVDLDPEKYALDNQARTLFPVRVPRVFIDKIEKNNIDDPILKQVMADRREFEVVEGYNNDPLEEHDTVAEGLLHKYRNRVLMIVKSGCAVNCRYCFRRHFPYEDNSPNKKRWQPALDYISAHPEINEVIFSGGDPLMAKDSHLAWLIEKISEIAHIKRLRIHTRLPVVIPQRITQTLCDTLANSQLQTVMVLHINHAQEIDQLLADKIKTLRAAGITLYNQSVLLQGVNDKATTLADLSEKLFEVGVQPYYLHLLDSVAGAAHFDLPEVQAKAIYQELHTLLPGFLVPRMVREIAGEASKTPISL